MNIKELRNKYGLTIKDAADATSVPYRTFCRYEQDENYGNKLKRQMIIHTLKENILK